VAVADVEIGAVEVRCPVHGRRLLAVMGASLRRRPSDSPGGQAAQTAQTLRPRFLGWQYSGQTERRGP
jgi:hypothetical protein